NAGYGLFGVVEDLSEAEARAQMETNFFGALWVTQAALPIMREQQRGHILQVSSIGGILAWPMLSLYHASKWAMEGLSEALSQEVAAFGIRITLIEPGPYSTDWRDVSSVWESPSEPYVGLGKANRRPGSGMPQGDPAATAAAILQVVDSDSPPLRLFLGDSLTALARTKYLERIGTWEEWEPVARAAQGK
ncbi:MAG: SDR family NAD(P)-dependent oxidoreductase, partial [Oscillochloris sp.]|nr:SDR family NAD(P)-dependent oxidoreductase [Oscillochloris sp.]